MAGAFYPAERSELLKEIQRCFTEASVSEGIPLPAALVCPHAGYIYSGAAAASAYSCVPQGCSFECVVVIGPNHRGFGPVISAADFDTWETPLGDLRANRTVLEQLVSEVPGCAWDTSGHSTEHSVEVQLPFLISRLAPGFSIVPLVTAAPATQDGLRLSSLLSQALARALEGKRALIVASSDMSHYVSEARAEQEDALAIDAVSRLDEQELVDVVASRRIGMCGAMPAVVAIGVARARGASRGVLVDYRTSGEVTGDRQEVVSYGAMALVS